jgi:ATP-dependent DNA helicase DinG
VNSETVAATLSPHGRLRRTLAGYESRPEQVRMARAVAATFAEGGVLVVEAGTGTGKSFAYLVPAVHWSRENRRPVIVSTRTINLQEQLVKKDLPDLAAGLGIDFTAVLVKGRSNYFCLRKAAEVSDEPALLVDDAVRAEVRELVEWSRSTEDGSLSDLPFVPRPDAWEQVSADNDDCLRSRCPDYEQCFFYRARRAAADADVLVVNHHLLMADLSLRGEMAEPDAGGILPPSPRLVVDEAHHLEDVATDYFGATVTLRRIEQALTRLQHPRTAPRGVLPALAEKLVEITVPEDRPAAEGAARWIEERLRRRAPELVETAARVFDSVLVAFEGAMPRSGRASPGETEERGFRIVPEVRESDWWRRVAAEVSELGQRLLGFAEETGPVLERIDELSEGSAASVLFLATRLRALAGRVAAAGADLATFVEEGGDLCRWIGVRPGRDRAPIVRLSFAPVEVGPRLEGSLFAAYRAVVLTSATLSVGKRFDYFLERSGIARLPEGAVETLRIASPFRFEDQALVVVPDDLPEPDRPGHEPALHAAIDSIVGASGGGAFVLFTSYAALLRAHQALAGAFGERRLLVLRQGEASRHALLDRFRKHRSAVLFATDSFWEGVDVRGEALRVVVIARLPFRVPTDPIVAARVEAVAARGADPFVEYTLPQAVIKLRQGFGRLIRSRDDRGVVALLDSRITRRRYGEVFLDSLPPARLVVASAATVFDEVGKFFGPLPGPAAGR